MEDYAERQTGEHASINVPSFLRRLERGQRKVEATTNLLAAGAILLLLLLGTAQVILRKLFSLPIYGYIDIIELGMVLFTFLGLAYCQSYGGHIRVDILVRHTRGRLNAFLEWLGVLVGFCIVCILTWFTALNALRAFTLGDTSMDAHLPIWPSKMLVAIALGLVGIRLLFNLISNTVHMFHMSNGQTSSRLSDM